MLSVSKLERQRTSGPQKRTKSDFMYCSQHLGASSRNPRRNPRCLSQFCEIANRAEEFNDKTCVNVLLQNALHLKFVLNI